MYSGFQYILCCGSTQRTPPIFRDFLVISIHLMLRFNHHMISLSLKFLEISIHLMLRFNLTVPNVKGFFLRFQYILCCGSTAYSSDLYRRTGFQYILCCGSTLLWLSNQSFRLLFQYILCCGSTDSMLHGKSTIRGFQYILCCGSTRILALILALIFHFNTSYVAVQHFRRVK